MSQYGKCSPPVSVRASKTSLALTITPSMHRSHRRDRFDALLTHNKQEKITHRYLKGHLLQINKSRNVFNSHCLRCKIYRIKTRRLHSRCQFIFFFYQNNVFQAQTGVLLFFYPFETETFLLLFTDHREEYFPLAKYRGIKYAAQCLDVLLSCYIVTTRLYTFTAVLPFNWVVLLF